LEVEYMPNSENVEFARLIDWVEGRLSEQEARIVEEQVAADRQARADADWLRAFARISEDTVIVSPPPDVRDALIERFEAYAEGKQHPGLLERLVATLTFDSNLQPAPGLRGAGIQESQRQVVYSTDAADVAINVRPRPHDGLLDLDGQIFPVNSADSDTFGVQLLDGSFEVATTATNHLSEFTFEAVPPGVYEVLASNERVEIQIPHVELNL
jgi:hypothetical protein